MTRMIVMTTYDNTPRWYNPDQIVSVEACRHAEKDIENHTTIYANGDWSVVRHGVGQVLDWIRNAP